LKKELMEKEPKRNRPTDMLPQIVYAYQEELEKFLEMWDTITNANITTSRRPSCPII